MGQSFLSKMYTYSPLNHLGAGKMFDPFFYKTFGGYTTSSGPGTPGPYAGKTPTLADANGGYTQAMADAAAKIGPNATGYSAGTAADTLFNKRPLPAPTGTPKPMSGTPMVPGANTQPFGGGVSGY